MQHQHSNRCLRREAQRGKWKLELSTNLECGQKVDYLGKKSIIWANSRLFGQIVDSFGSAPHADQHSNIYIDV